MRLALALTVLVSLSALGACSSSSSGTGQAAGGTAGLGGAGGGGAVGGGGGVGGGTPFTRASKLDVLFMVDNSRGMADKQAVLRDTIPTWIQALTNPPEDPSTGKPYFAPITDIHFGVISSSLGGHGGDICSPAMSAQFNETQNDRAHLLPAERNLPSYQELGFLWWDPTQAAGGESDVNVLTQQLQSHVIGAGAEGCGYEAPLEAWYRFLLDPAPALDFVADNGVITPQGLDSLLLKQRADFLRADSALVVVALTDENDCSIEDSGQNWIAAQAQGGGGAFHLPGGTSKCDVDPNDPCCFSCASTVAPTGCLAADADPACANGVLDDVTDHLNVRCFDQQRRFGLDFLYPTSRYVSALTSSSISDASGNLVPNPLLVGRNPGLITFVPIVGVPWQDIATTESLTSADLEYLDAAGLESEGRWSWMVPECQTPNVNGGCDVWKLSDKPDDPLMQESIEPRTGVHPATDQALSDPDGPVFSASGVPNGHEFLNPSRNELQYACIFELPAPRDCSSTPESEACDCESDPAPSSWKSPLCQQENGTYTTVQRFAKAYPGTRLLEVAKDLGDRAVVGSICPKSLTPGGSSFAYTATVNALVKRLSGVMVQAN
jgi:hypothetical protein